jgi:hypothetical protein
MALCLSLVAIGCGNDAQEEVIDDILNTGGTGGAAGMGGSAGMGGEGGMGGMATPTDACTNVDDLAIVCDAGFGDEVSTCARAESGQGGPTADCLVRDTGVSQDCATCYGNVTQCIFDSCLADCATDPDSEECLQCRADNCDTAFNSCTGDLMAGCE